MKKFLIIAVCVVLMISMFVSGDSEKPAKQMLKAGEVQKFIDVMPKLKADLKRFNVKYEAKEGTINFADALTANQEFLGILKKHGWDETFFQKSATILLGYSMVVYKQNMVNVDSELAKSLNEIENNTALSVELKKQLKEQLMQAKSAMKQADQQWRNSIHPEDLALITPKVTELKKILEAQ